MSRNMGKKGKKMLAFFCMGLLTISSLFFGERQVHAEVYPYIDIEAEDYTSMSGIATEDCDEGTEDVGYIEAGDYLVFEDVNFSKGAESFEARVACTGDGGTINIYLDSLNGTKIGTCTVSTTGGWQTYATQTCDVDEVSGVHDLYLEFEGGSGYLFNINWFTFIGSEDEEDISYTYTPQGFGAEATGGSEVYHVTNLNDSGSGSLRDAVSESGREVVFDVAGTITITSALVIESNTTVDGSTAPSPGITVEGYNTSMSNRHNIIIKNMRFREGLTGPSGKCSLQGSNCYNIMIDHCSIENGRWDCLSFTNDSYDITVQYSIIGQGIDPQHFGGLMDAGDDISLHHNLWIGNDNRNPKLKSNTQYINNVVYNWGNSGGVQGGHSSAAWQSDFIGNYFIKGPSSSTDNWINNCTSNDQWYQYGNYKDMDCDGSLDGTEISTTDFEDYSVTLLSSVVHSPTVAVTIDSAQEAVADVVAGEYGCQPMDDYDTELISDVASYGIDGSIED